MASIWSISIATLLIIIYLIVVAAAVYTIIHDKRDPVKALSWIMVIVLLPIAGFVLYVFFGQNYRKSKIFNRKEMRDLELSMHFDFAPASTPTHLDIYTLLKNNNKSVLTTNNSARIMTNGRATFDAIKRVLTEAKSSIHLESYIICDDFLGQEIAAILIDRASAGVEVRVIYDDVGSWDLGSRYVNRLRAAGVKIYPFMPVVFPWLTSKINYRNHRKIIVVDGTMAFTGGVNIAKRYISGDRLGQWRDTHMQLRGDVVRSLQIAFITDWLFVSGEKLANTHKYLPPNTENNGDLLIQVATSGPDSDWASIMQTYFAAISKAEKHIYISTPYFLPNEAILTALKVASLSGVDVRLMIPYRSDSKIVYWATRSYISELLDANVGIYLYRNGFNHSKVLMIDSSFSSIGTANMDIRSFEDNFECSAFIYDSAVTRELEHTFLDDLDGCLRVSRECWADRPRHEVMKESFARLFSPLL